ncbi:hypothetical protein Vadar_012937 [Vaccinium darrowii]|uniref:Uncharacterized protein n=1 Tax=Vaccinium darrowii TaxID=229202 RepID=A0ACB7Z4C2_9ERIC|nr:hypothetical protein Vadar_012937 [Vaccinium darrowii]
MGVVIIDGTTVRDFVSDEGHFNKSINHIYILSTRPQPRWCVIPIRAAEGFGVVPSPGDALRRRYIDAVGGAGEVVRFDLQQVRLPPQRVDRSGGVSVGDEEDHAGDCGRARVGADPEGARGR